MYSGWRKKTLKHEISLWELITTRGIIHGTKPKHSLHARWYSLERPLYRLKTLLSGGKSKIKTLQKQNWNDNVLPWRKQCHLPNLGCKGGKNKQPTCNILEEIAFHMLHIPSKSPQFWSADLLQNYPLLTSNVASIWSRGPVMKRSCVVCIDTSNPT